MVSVHFLYNPGTPSHQPEPPSAMTAQPLPPLAPAIQSAQVHVPCTDLAASIAFLTSRLGFKVRMVMPSEAPALAVLSGHGCNLRLEVSASAPPMRLRLLCDLRSMPDGAPQRLEGPDGLLVDLVDANPALAVPPGTQEFVLTRMGGPESFGVGRAGMLYRDLIPSRLGGRFVASHICIPQGGPVPDYVHFHRVRFQMIFCKAGWVRLVYEDQGEPFILKAGDCVLQPPEIRHRVLEASDGLEVVEVGCPALHETCGDPEMPLPTGADLPQREYRGQKFVRHVAAGAVWGASRLPGFEARDTGIAWATGGLAGVRVLRAAAPGALGTASAAAPATAQLGVADRHQGEFAFLFVLAGQTRMDSASLGRHGLAAGDCCVLPAGADYAFSPEPGLEMLEVTLPAVLPA